MRSHNDNKEGLKDYVQKQEAHTGGMSHRAIGKELGISRSMVFLIEKKALAKLGIKKNHKTLKPFLGGLYDRSL